MVQSSVGKQYSGDSYFREQDFIQTNPHGTRTNPKVLSSTTLCSQKFTQAFPNPRSPCDIFSANKGSPAELWGILMADLSCRSGLSSLATPGHREKGRTLKWWLPLHRSFRTGSDSVVSRVQEASDEW
jgi:hypothetical protein